MNNKLLKKHGKKILFATICVGVGAFQVTNVFAATDDPLAVINNLSDFILSIIQGIGLILLAWGIAQVGIAIKSHDPSQRANGFLTLAGGVIIAFTKQILELITS